eukprot:1408595-Rhodomonas_salina.1
MRLSSRSKRLQSIPITQGRSLKTYDFEENVPYNFNETKGKESKEGTKKSQQPNSKTYPGTRVRADGAGIPRNSYN